MEAPFEATTWNDVAGAYYAGFGGAEGLWLAAMLALVLIAVIGGWRHERHAYDALKNKR